MLCLDKAISLEGYGSQEIKVSGGEVVGTWSLRLSQSTLLSLLRGHASPHSFLETHLFPAVPC